MDQQLDWIFKTEQPHDKEEELIPWWLYYETPQYYEPMIPEWLGVPHIDTYDEWLQKRYSRAYKRNPNIIPDPIEPKMTQFYRHWRNVGPAMRATHPLNEQISSGQHHSFGTWLDVSKEPPVPQPIHGPLNQDDFYPEPVDYGPDFEEPFDNTEKYRAVLSRFGYEIVSSITKGNTVDEPYDHQVWRVREIGTNREYAMKVSAAHMNYNGVVSKATSKMMARLENESKVRKLLNHPNIVQTIASFGIRDSFTAFSYVFIANVMELMDGTTLDMAIKHYPNRKRHFQVPEHVAIEILVQIGKAVDYLHNHPGNLIIVHQAIRSPNILYNQRSRIGQDPKSRFKLTDFEDCIIYNRSNQIPDQPIDRLYGRIPFRHQNVGPEFVNAKTSREFRTLRTMPNDIHCLAFTVMFLMEGVDSSRRARKSTARKANQLQRQTQCQNHLDELLRLMTIVDPEQRITAHDLVNHPYFKRFDV